MDGARGAATEIAARFAPDKMIGSPVVTLVDDPTVPGAYGGFRFDDAGELATAVPLIDRGKLVGRIARELRPGHTGMLEPLPSHLRFAPGGSESVLALKAGFSLEGHRGVLVDPASDRIVIAVQRALEVEHGQRTGRVYADIELVGDLTTLLGSITDATKATRGDRPARRARRAAAMALDRSALVARSRARTRAPERSVIDRRSLVRALGHEDLADWVVIQRDQELAVVDDDVQRTEQRTRWHYGPCQDTPAGRGTAHVAIDANEQDPDKLVAEAATLARLSAGPAWATIPPAAPPASSSRIRRWRPANRSRPR